MGEVNPVHFSDHCRRWILSLQSDGDHGALDAERDLIAAARQATPTELRDGLIELWPLARYLPSVLHVEQADELDRQDPERHARLQQAALNADKALHDPETGEVIREYLERVVTSVRSLGYGGTLAAALPDLPCHSVPADSLVDVSLGEERARRGLACFRRLASDLAASLADQDAYWATVGYCRPDAYETAPPKPTLIPRIRTAREMLLRARLAGGHADIVDHWMLFRESEEWTEREGRSLFRCIERTSTAECEQYLNSVHLLETGVYWHLDPPLMPESDLPEADAIWTHLLARRDLSRVLLARGGHYYWDASGCRRGPALALAAFAFHVLEVPDELDRGFLKWVPFLFFAAFDDAARRKNRPMAAACLNLALLLLRPFAALLSRADLDRVRVDSDRLYATLARFSNAETDNCRLPLKWALDAFIVKPELGQSRVGRVLDAMGRQLNVQVDDVEPPLREVVGEQLWGKLVPDTLAALRAAEVFWRSLESGVVRTESYSVVGQHWRIAIENEWRAKLRGVIPADTLGKLVFALREMGPIGKGMLRARCGDETPLCDSKFLREMLELVGFLNGAAHGRGLARDEVAEWRGRLYEGRLLNEVLGAVQTTH